MIKRCLCLLMVFMTLVSIISTASAMTEGDVHQSLLRAQNNFPEGMAWGSGKAYKWSGGIYTTGYGCVAFSFMLSDSVFGGLPARQIKRFKYEDLCIGDILRMNNDRHTVTILEKYASGIVVIEGAYNRTVHWGRFIPRDEVMRASWRLTRYPEGQRTF